MIRLALFDARQLMRERLALGILVAGLLACAVAVITGHGWTARMAAERESVASEAEAYRSVEREAWAAASEGDPAAAVVIPGRLATTLILPEPRLADFSVGRSAIEPTAASIRMATRPDALFTRYQVENPERLMRGTLDLGFVVVVIAPLLLIGLGFGVFASDRDSGAARLWLAQAGSPLRLIATRSLIRLAIVAAPILLAALVLWLLGPPERGGAVLAWVGIALLGLLFWWAVILLVNSFNIAAETAALVLVGLWTLLVFVAPGAIGSLAALLNPPPSRFEAIAAARASEISASRSWDDDHPELSAATLEGRRASVERGVTVRAAIAESTADLAAETERQFGAQRALTQGLSLLAPPLLVAEGLTAAARTDAASQSANRQAAVRYLSSLGGALTDAALGRTAIDAASFDALPRFTAPPPARSPVWPIVWTGLLTLALAALALVRLRRARPF